MRRIVRVSLALALAGCGDSGSIGPRFVAVSAGAGHTCALTETGRAFCWGTNATGMLGTGDTALRRSPTPVEASFSFSRIAAGFLHTCGIRSDGAGFCWGINALGELGDGSRQERHVPAAVQGGHAFIDISAGEGASCGITASDSGLYCWGTDLFAGNAPAGRDSTRPARHTPGRFRSVSMGYEIACALRSDGQALCWGYGADGALGDGNAASSEEAVMVAQPGPFRAVSAGHAHACGMTVGGAIWCWGSNAFGQLGVAGILGSTIATQALVRGAVRQRGRSHGVPHLRRGGRCRQLLGRELHRPAW